jgi:hypothetical protein
MRFRGKRRIWIGLAAVVASPWVIGGVAGCVSEEEAANEPSPTVAASSVAPSTEQAPSPSSPSAPTAEATTSTGATGAKDATAEFRAWLTDQGFAETTWGRSFVEIDETGRIMTDLYPKQANQEAAQRLCAVYAVQYSPDDPVTIVKAADGVMTLAHYSVFNGRCEKG